MGLDPIPRIPYEAVQITHIPGPIQLGYPLNGVPNMGPKSHSYIGLPDGRQCDLGLWRGYKTGSQIRGWDPISDPLLEGSGLSLILLSRVYFNMLFPGVAREPPIWDPHLGHPRSRCC